MVEKVSHRPNFQFTAVLGRQFTHDRLLEPDAIRTFKDGLWPLAACPQIRLPADALPLVVPVHEGESGLPYRVAAGLPRISFGGGDAPRELDGWMKRSGR